MKKTRKLVCLALAAMMSLSMIGCGGGSTTAPTQAAGENTEPQTAPADDTAAPGAEKASCVKVGVSGIPNLDPACAATGSELIAMANIYDTLVFPDSTTEVGVAPRAAEGWDVSEDGLTYTFTLKEGIKFHNGDTMTAEDVVYSMNRFLEIGEGNSFIFDGHINSGDVEATDDKTVVFHLQDSYGPFVNALIRVGIVNKDEVEANYETSDSTYGDKGDYGKGYLLTNDAGSGAYQAKELVQQDYFYAEKYDDWFMGWSNEKAPEAFKMMAITEAATVRTMMNNKELDITDTWQSVETLNALSQIEGVSLATLSNGLVYCMYFNNAVAPMDDVNFRKALNCLIDKDTICQNILFDSTPAYGAVSSKTAGAVQTTQYPYDLEKAKEYLAASKYASNFQDYPIEFVVNSDVADLEKIALLFQSAAQQLGIKVEISKAPWVSLIDQMGSAETSPQITMINYSSAVDDAGTYLQSRYAKATQGTWNNGEWLEDEYFETTLNAALVNPDTASRMQAYGELQKYIVDEICASGFVCDLAERCAYQSAYLSWPFVESAPEGQIATISNGYTQIYSEMTYDVDKK